jgi:hypothetical protein
MARFKVGDKVKTRVRHNGLKSGTNATVTGVYGGTFYTLAVPGTGGGSYISPDTHVVADPDPSPSAPDNDSDDEATGVGTAANPTGPASAAASAGLEHLVRVKAWDRLMGMVTKRPRG